MQHQPKVSVPLIILALIIIVHMQTGARVILGLSELNFHNCDESFYLRQSEGFSIL